MNVTKTTRGPHSGVLVKGEVGACRLMDVVYHNWDWGKLQNLKAIGVKVSPGTLPSHLKDVGMLMSEELERERRDPANKYWLAQ